MPGPMRAKCAGFIGVYFALLITVSLKVRYLSYEANVFVQYILENDNLLVRAYSC